MKTNLLYILRRGNLRAAFNHGKWRARYLHVSTNPREAVRHALRQLLAGAREAGSRRNLSRAMRDDRRALYLGQFACLRAERRMMAAFNL